MGFQLQNMQAQAGPLLTVGNPMGFHPQMQAFRRYQQAQLNMAANWGVVGMGLYPQYAISMQLMWAVSWGMQLTIQQSQAPGVAGKAMDIDKPCMVMSQAAPAPQPHVLRGEPSALTHHMHQHVSEPSAS